jgi:adenylyltransferase/sulfurtransferase
LVVGAGGLGGPIAYALAAANARAITVCDGDRVELSNLQRQIQFTVDDIGTAKALALAAELERRGFSRDRVRAVPEPLTAQTAPRLLEGADVAIDASDDLATKFCLNDAACAAGVPVVIAAVTRSHGHVLGAIPGETACYRCLFEAPPEGDDASNCSTAGVFGAAAAIVAAVAARSALDLAAGRGPAGEIAVFDDLRAQQPPRRVRYNRRPGCSACALADSITRTS